MKYFVSLILLVSLLFGFSSSTAKAEAGCFLSGGVTLSNVYLDAYGYGQYNCGNDVASNYARHLQVCLIQNGTWLVCADRDNLSNTLWRINVADYSCRHTADLWQYRMWIWFYGEDGSVASIYTPLQSGYISCT